MHGNQGSSIKKLARKPEYVIPNQLTICGFETPFGQALSFENR